MEQERKYLQNNRLLSIFGLFLLGPLLFTYITAGCSILISYLFNILDVLCGFIMKGGHWLNCVLLMVRINKNSGKIHKIQSCSKEADWNRVHLRIFFKDNQTQHFTIWLSSRPSKNKEQWKIAHLMHFAALLIWWLISGKQIRGSLQKVPINHEEYEKNKMKMIGNGCFFLQNMADHLVKGVQK